MTNMHELAANTGYWWYLGYRVWCLDLIESSLRRAVRGTVMSEFGRMTGLSWLSMNDNDLTGQQPDGTRKPGQHDPFYALGLYAHGHDPLNLTHDHSGGLDSRQERLYRRVSQEVYDLRLRELNLFVTELSQRRQCVCAVPECCTFCRRGDSSGSNKGNGRGLNIYESLFTYA
jgi:hypothetical protein